MASLTGCRVAWKASACFTATARLDDDFGRTRVRKAQMTENRITRRKASMVFAASAAAAGMLPIGARAEQSYPSRPVRFVLPFAAAGVADITARVAAEKVGDKLGQRFVVENQPGPGGIWAARAGAPQGPDGHTNGPVTTRTPRKADPLPAPSFRS